MRSTIGFCLLVLTLAGCAISTQEFLQRQEGVSVTAGYVLKLQDLRNPNVLKLSDGTAYTVTEEGCSVILEFDNPSGLHGRRRRRQLVELAPGDIFVQSRPFSYTLQRPKAASAPGERRSGPVSGE